MKAIVIIIFIALISCVPAFEPIPDDEQEARTNGPLIILPLPDKSIWEDITGLSDDVTYWYMLSPEDIREWENQIIRWNK